MLYYIDLKIDIINAFFCSVLLLYAVTFVPTDLQEKVLAELQEGPSLSPPGMELGFDLGLDLGPSVPLFRLKALGALNSRGPSGQRARLSLLGAETGWDLFVEERKWVVGNLWSYCGGQGKSCSELGG